MITRLRLSTMRQDLPKYRSMLAGNDAFSPTSFESIATVNLASTTSFTSIPSTYQHLQLRLFFSDSGNGTRIRLNNDTTPSNYIAHSVYGVNISGTMNTYTNVSTGIASITNLNTLYGGFPTTDFYGVAIIDIHDYASTTKNKTARVFSGLNSNGGNAEFVALSSGLWMSTAAVNRIDISFANLGTAALYGIKGA